ncbi:hypothetical protein FTUN_3400 [Frigoriglobus tundricola]|uniref:Uncharacterized protein n=1 Tax=Frigoriglobus tundricola TaxID=2774151 RepID=A0A6M5YR71_9BACT|nr:hypothetical protein FTUN_3400 [Frigoriglobus tundricola]
MLRGLQLCLLDCMAEPCRSVGATFFVSWTPRRESSTARRVS